MRTMKLAYMLRGVKSKKYVLEEQDLIWFKAELGSNEDVKTHGRHFICEQSHDRIKELADRYNESVSENDEKVEIVRVLRGFLPLNLKEWKDIPEKLNNDVVWRKDVYKLLHDLGGAGSENHTWDAGWDAACDTAIENIKALKGANVT